MVGSTFPNLLKLIRGKLLLDRTRKKYRYISLQQGYTYYRSAPTTTCRLETGIAKTHGIDTSPSKEKGAAGPRTTMEPSPGIRSY